MRCACIDIGSNTTRLLVADCVGTGIVEVRQERAFTRIGAAVGEDGRIPTAKIAEVASVVVLHHRFARELGCDRVRAVATAAIRRAINGSDLAAVVESLSGIRVEILSEAEEARLAFVGAARTLGRAPTGELAVIDVGGGSSELAVGEPPDRVRWSISLPVGSSVLTERFRFDDPPAPAQVKAARAAIEDLLDGVDVPRPVEAVAVGGSATSLRRLVGDRLDPVALRRALAEVCASPTETVAARIGLDVQRVRLLPAGLLILETAAERLGVAPVIGNGGIREGVVMEAAAGRGSRP